MCFPKNASRTGAFMTKAEENVTKKHLLQFALHNSYTGSWLIFILAQFEGHMVDLVVAPTFLTASFDWFANVNRFKKSDMLLLRYFCLKLGRDQNCFLAWTKCNESCWNFIQIAMHSHGGLSWRLEILYMFKMCVHCISLAWPGWWHKGEICAQIYWSCILSQSAQTDRFN